MRIDANANTIQYNNVQKPSFKGLTRAMSKSLFVDKSHLDCLVYAYPKADGFIGNLPKEFIKAIKSNNPNLHVKEAINQVKNVFAESSDFLQKVAYEKQYNSRKNYLKNKVMDTFLNNLAIRNDANLYAICKECYFNGKLSKNDLNEETKFVENKITDVFRNTGIIPKDAKASISYIDSGAYGDVFKMSFLDKNENKLFHDKVMKVYKSPEDISNMFAFAIDTLHEIPKTISKQDFTKKLSDITECSYMFFDVKCFEDCYEFIKNCSQKDFMFMKSTAFYKDLHGVAPEANAALYMKKSIGHPIANTNLIEPYCFDMKHNYGILELSDTDLKTTKEVDFKPLGVKCMDNHIFNYINGKLIDYGGFGIDNQKLVDDKVARRAAKVQAHNTPKKEEDMFAERVKDYGTFSFSTWSMQ